MGTEAVLRGASGDHGQKDERQRGVVDHEWVCCEEGDCEVVSGDCASNRDDRRRRGPGGDDRRGNGCHDESGATPVSKREGCRWGKATEHRSIVIAIARAIGALLSRGTNQRVALFCAC